MEEVKEVVLKLKRHTFTEDYTVGELSIDGKYICDVIEDKVRHLKSIKDKIPGRTAIPAGTYRIVIDFSNRFGKMMPHILSVPFFEGVRIHKGNSANDSSGCLIVCFYDKNGWGIDSKKAYDLVYGIISKEINAGHNVKISIE